TVRRSAAISGSDPHCRAAGQKPIASKRTHSLMGRGSDAFTDQSGLDTAGQVPRKEIPSGQCAGRSAASYFAAGCDGDDAPTRAANSTCFTPVGGWNTKSV